MDGLQDYLKTDRIYKPSELKEVLAIVRKHFRFAWKNKDLRYFNVPCSFDIETSSFYYNGLKCACMYEWSFCLYGLVIIGRTWEEFVDMTNELCDILKLSDNTRLVCFCHNLNYEFQFMRKWFTWSKVFAVDERKPVYAITDRGIEFRCSYILSGYSLVKIGNDLREYQIKKLLGYLDYELLRHSATPLTTKELEYCSNDVKVVVGYIAEKLDAGESIAKLQITKTGYVRDYCRRMCFEDETGENPYKRKNYREPIKGMTINPDEWEMLKYAFQGGFTHANPFAVMQVNENVTSFDFTSSYPTVLIAERFPMSRGEFVTITSTEEFEWNINNFCCIFEVEFLNIESAVTFDNYISKSRCWVKEKIQVSNGRIVRGKRICTTITNVDWDIIKVMYKWEDCKIHRFIRYRKGYLPTDFVKAILKLYQDKTTLKGVYGKETDYLYAKELLNSCYGMCVTSAVMEENPYTDHWLTKEEKPKIDVETELNKYNINRNRFLFYPWGVFCTAYARRNLFLGILEFGEDYLYSDTDSIKVLNAERHIVFIEKYNQMITKRLELALDFHKIPHNAIRPKTVKGVEKPLGVWDFDGHYKRFKPLRAKAYMVEYSDDKRNGESANTISITVSGINKHIATPYIFKGLACNVKTHEMNFDTFKLFDDEMHVPADYTGKMTHTYIDAERHGIITDYLGNTAEFYEKSAIHLENTSYDLHLDGDFVSFVKSLSFSG